MNPITRIAGAAVGSTVFAALLAAGCATSPSPAELDAQARAAVKASFRDQGIAKATRIDQDALQAACSSDKPPNEQLVEQIQADAMRSVRWPAGGQYLGDWRAGEKLAQDGRGMTWTDASDDPKGNGGNCYNCHQIDKKELSYGTIGPSLWNYGKQRGVADPSSPVSAPIVQYTWAKLYNAKAFAACSTMPRFGYKHLLNEQQMRDLMALLLDPKSPVNQ
ncbi:MAG: sulfur oxidation c-type cytochrome SoxX [Burkholderiales bacterium]|nr:sulfur oxidation c-type cytochrome SoxX [Burkholderiales bacterium]